MFQTSLDFSVKPCGPTQPRIPCWCVSSDPSMCWQAIWTWDHAQGCMGPAPRFGSLFGSSSDMRSICFGDICSQLCLQQMQARTLAKHAPPQGRFFSSLHFLLRFCKGIVIAVRFWLLGLYLRALAHSQRLDLFRARTHTHTLSHLYNMCTHACVPHVK